MTDCKEQTNETVESAKEE